MSSSRAAHRKMPVRMDFTQVERSWLREIVKEVTWVRMARQGVGPTSAHRTLTHMAHFERWAGERLDRGPEAIDRALLGGLSGARAPTAVFRERAGGPAGVAGHDAVARQGA